MTQDQATIFAILGGVFVLFAWGRWRHDLVAFLALLATVIAGLVTPTEAFLGFGHPATVTVALVLILSRALSNSGAIDPIARRLARAAKSELAHIAGLSGIAALLSAAMNNVGALALLMPVALQTAEKVKRSPAIILMPLSFGSILGGLVTLIGTPPNVIIASYRGEITGTPFAMFDFTPVGATIAVAGVAFIALIGWRLIPKARRGAAGERALFDLEGYVAEVHVPEGAPAVGMTVAEIENAAREADVVIVGVLRDDERVLGIARRRPVGAGDVLIVEATPEDLDTFAAALGLEILGTEGTPAKLLKSRDIAVMEAVVPPRAPIVGSSVLALRLRSRYGVNLLAVSRQGTPIRKRLRAVRLRAGDVLLLQGDAARLGDVIAGLGCLPLAGRGLQVGRRRGKAGLAAAIFAGAVAVAALGLAPLPLALAVAALAVAAVDIVPPRELYDAVDWPIIVVLGSMIPVGMALEKTGGTALIADALLAGTNGMPPAVVLALLMILTMTLSDVINNAATAVVTAPIAVSLATRLAVDIDPFLMAVAIGASCAFLTPIGHQNNMLILGPGGYRFGDYWRMGLPLEILIVAIAVPMILWIWPF